MKVQGELSAVSDPLMIFEALEDPEVLSRAVPDSIAWRYSSLIATR